jgi:hypothetical protein
MERPGRGQRPPPARSGRWTRSRVAAASALLVPALLVFQLVGSVSGALFTATQAATISATTGRIFPGVRVTPAFSVGDSSSGSTVDRSNPIAYQGDGRYAVVHPWPTAFDTSRRVDVALNDPLPGGLAVSGAQLAVTLASDAAGATACWYADLVRTSDGSVVSSHGSDASPVACVTGTTVVRTLVPLAAVTRSDLANDLTIRIYGRSSTGAAARIDEVAVSGATPYAAFTLYPVRTQDAYGGGTETIPWKLAGA